MFISNAFASGGLAAGDIMSTIIQLGLIFLIFYILLIRPQQKKMKHHNEMLLAIKSGDNVLTGGGVYAKVKKVDGSYITVEVSDNVEFVINRMTIRDVVKEDLKKSESRTKTAEKPATKKNKTKTKTKTK